MVIISVEDIDKYADLVVARVAWPWQTGVGTGDHQCRGSPQPMSRARRFRPRARGGLGGLVLGLLVVLVVVDVLPRAEAAYSCTSNADCEYLGCAGLNSNQCVSI